MTEIPKELRDMGANNEWKSHVDSMRDVGWWRKPNLVKMTTPDGSIRCSPYFNSGDEEGNEIAEFGCGYNPLEESDLKDLVSRCEKLYRNSV